MKVEKTLRMCTGGNIKVSGGVDDQSVRVVVVYHSVGWCG